MKTLYRITIAGIIFFCGLQAHAQFSAGLQVGMYSPTEKNSDAQYGVNINGKYNINQQLRVGINIGYFLRSYSTVVGEASTYTSPLSIFGEYSFGTDQFRPYVGADLGSYTLGLKILGVSASESFLGFAPVAGFDYSLSEKLLLNGNLKFHVVTGSTSSGSSSSTSALSVLVGLMFKF